MTTIGSSNSVVMTVSLFPKVNIVERFLRGARLEKKPAQTSRQGVQQHQQNYTQTVARVNATVVTNGHM